MPDVVVGTAWLASGQSNMEFPLQAATGGETEIAHSRNPRLRQFHVEKAVRFEPADDCHGKWVLAAPETAGDFTAVGYYFGKRLQAALDRPVGIINASWGGTFSEAWTSIDAINRAESLGEAEEARRKARAEYPGPETGFRNRIRRMAAGEPPRRQALAPAPSFLPANKFLPHDGPA